MNKPKQPKRAKPELDRDSVTRPMILSTPIHDGVAAYIGQVVADYVHLEARMIGVFRVILGIRSGEVATITYHAIKSPNARWQIATDVLEKSHNHITTPHIYDEVIAEFKAITACRNKIVHGLWQMGPHDQPWLTLIREPLDSLRPVHFPKQQFNDLLARIDALGRVITNHDGPIWQDRAALDKEWLAHPPPTPE
jgi:hypothetical protein